MAAWRIAVTSADGVLVNQHFGHAEFFYIIDIDRDGSFTVAEKRKTAPWCVPGVQEKDAEPGGSGIADSIKDCAAVLTARIGPPARKKLELAGLSVFETPAVIADAVKKLAVYYGKTRRTETKP
ncbi:MAG: dinitrogenase iron-molybdenum cofactor biosynthesis protein [Treponema sp.]|jgi:predicted Fe-Mo cluster-binding NifX family protein|nr:dinitrogenase iron-molybdenum cofactor biosynthesis protein [Treponema sp.]